MKNIIIVYVPAYGGQSFRKKGVKQGWESFINFVDEMTVPIDNYSMELNITEGNNSIIKSTGYKSEEFIKEATRLFGEGRRTQYIGNIWDENLKEYKYDWKIAKEDFERCIEFLNSVGSFPEAEIEPIWIDIGYFFYWKHNQIDGSKMIGTHDGSNLISLTLSEDNSIITDFIFPFEKVDAEFLNLITQIEKNLPIKLSPNRFRYWIPNKKETGYKVKKLLNADLKMIIDKNKK